MSSRIDEDGYLSIRGRLKRFAKIGGETVSLTVVENCASALWPDHAHAAIAVPDGRKGERSCSSPPIRMPRAAICWSGCRITACRNSRCRAALSALTIFRSWAAERPTTVASRDRRRRGRVRARIRKERLAPVEQS